jgi:RloB-like protein
MAKRGHLKNIGQQREADVEERPVRFRRYKYLFLIVCEDQKTEPAYFEQFKIKIPQDTIFLKPVGTGRDPKGVVEKAVEERQKLAAEAKKEVDVVWVVFDKDDADENATKIDRFNAAFDRAKKEKINVAYSNEVFELWFLLHFSDVDSAVPLPRSLVYELLQKRINQHPLYADFVYNHYKPDNRIHRIINEIGDETAAIERAGALLQNQKKRKPIEANPSTTVYLLVKELMDWIAYFSYNPKES